MIVRPSIKSDLAAVDALLARTYPKLLKADYPPSVLVTALPLISRAPPALLSCGTYYVVERDRAILGAGGWTPDRKDCTLGQVRHVVTDDRILRRGVGRAVMHHCFDAARRAGLVRLECWSTRTESRSIGPLVLPPLVLPPLGRWISLYRPGLYFHPS